MWSHWSKSANGYAPRGTVYLFLKQNRQSFWASFSLALPLWKWAINSGGWTVSQVCWLLWCFHGLHLCALWRATRKVLSLSVESAYCPCCVTLLQLTWKNLHPWKQNECPKFSPLPGRSFLGYPDFSGRIQTCHITTQIKSIRSKNCLPYMLYLFREVEEAMWAAIV